MKKVIYTLSVILIAGMAFNQEVENMVPNPGFEEVSGKISKLGQIDKANGWISGTAQAADLFSNRSKDPNTSVPTNVYGDEEPMDGNGGNYAGIVAFSHNNKIPRSYITTKLTVPMKKGMKYCVSFHVSLAEFSKYNSNNIAAHFSKRQYNFEEKVNIIEEPHVKHVDNVIFKATYNWDKICGVYNATGGEKYITIGNFENNEDTQSDKNKVDKEMKGTPVIGAYYYIDNITVKMIDFDDECDCEVKEEKVKEVIYSSSILRPEDIEAIDIASYNTLYYAQGKTDLNTQSEKNLQEVADVMLKNDNFKITITAHSDKSEEEKADTKPAYENLSSKRAEEVKKFLTNEGVRPERIIIVDKKAEVPVDDSGSEIGLAKNRRVELKFSK
ncbi:MAG: OmpA family protein [Crocinitomicaceae bacterium]|nr:OmpA family protein [Crocinitomicaceae bacterium]